MELLTHAAAPNTSLADLRRTRGSSRMTQFQFLFLLTGLRFCCISILPERLQTHHLFLF
jgi:hypothetical protein